MRTIKFRGKSENGKWLYGSLLKIAETHFIIPSTNVPLMRYFQYYVENETIGQYTSVKDKHDKEIYEGDILRSDIYPFNFKNSDNYYAEVVWFSDTKQFGLIMHKNPQVSIRGLSDGNCCDFGDFRDGVFEVIGNIYDNKELLKD